MKSAVDKQEVVLAKKKYHSPTLTNYGSIAQLTKASKGGRYLDGGGSPPDHRTSSPS